MHELLHQAEQYIKSVSAYRFGRKQLDEALLLISSANTDVNQAILLNAIDCFDVPRINKDLIALEKKANVKFLMTKRLLQEEEKKGHARNARNSARSVTYSFAEYKRRMSP